MVLIIACYVVEPCGLVYEGSKWGEKMEEDFALKLYNDAFRLESEGRYVEAIKVYEQSAKLGFTSSMINLGNIYFEDACKNIELAKKYYRMAASHLNPAGAWNLYIVYRDGGNKRRSQFWLKRAAELGEEDAIDILNSGDSELN